MTDFDRNIRTLIVCFVLAVVGLVPLEILEVNRSAMDQVKVLGEMEDNSTSEESQVIEMEDEGESLPDEAASDIILPEVGGLE